MQQICYCDKKIIRLVFLLLIFSMTISYPQKSNEYELGSVLFKGNDNFSSATLSNVIQSRVTPWWGWKFLNSFTPFGSSPAYFDSLSVPIDIISLKSFYRSNGFFLADISAKYDLDSSSMNAKVTFIIRENESFKNNLITFYGIDNLPEDLFKKIHNGFDFKRNDKYSEEKTELKIREIIYFLNNNGYINASYNRIMATIDSTKKTVDLDIYLSTGRRYKVGDIIVEKTGLGKNDIDEDLIRDITDFKKYEYINLSELEIKRKRLVQTEIFNQVLITPAIVDTNDVVPLVIKGDIGEMNELSPEIIGNDLGGDFNMGLGINYKRKNFLGGARQFGIHMQGIILDVFDFNFKNFFKTQQSRDTTFQGQINVSANLWLPFLFKNTLSAFFQAYYKSATIAKTSISELGMKMNLDFEMNPYTFINALSPYVNYEYTEVIPNLDIKNLKFNVSSVTSAVGVELGSLKADDIQYPSSGYNFSFILEGATSRTDFDLKGTPLINSIGSDRLLIKERTWFYSLQTSAMFYIPLSRNNRFVNGIKLKIGYIQTFEGSDRLIPSNKTFFVGGTSSLRGWGARELFPKDTIYYFGINSEDLLRGGTFLLEGSFELRNKFTEDFGAALFLDYGNIWNGYKSFRFSDIAIATGFGFRYYTIIIPFRIDFGFKFYDPASRQFIWNNWQPAFWKNIQFNFGIGEAF